MNGTLRNEGAGMAQASSGMRGQGTGAKPKPKFLACDTESCAAQRPGDCSLGLGQFTATVDLILACKLEVEGAAG